MASRTYWTLNKLLVLFLTATFLALTADLRYEHVDKVRHHWTAWIPIVYSGAMVVVCVVCLFLWERRGRQALFFAFAFGLVVGLLGFWLHNQGHMGRDLLTLLQAWTRFEHHQDLPPTLAPLSFCGLGALGMLACAARFQHMPLAEARRRPDAS